MALDTRAVHAGRDDLVDLGVHAVPLDFSTTYPARDSAAEAARLDTFATGEMDGGLPIYSRVSNPTVERFESAIAELEGCQTAVAFASGMAALSACLLASVVQGKPHVVAVRPLYGTTDHLLESGLLGTFVTWAAADEVASAIRPDTGLVVVESPANPTLTEVDIAAVTEAAGPVPVLVDNTFATPVLQRPVEHGARITMHSATKFLGGHGDVMGGVIACDEEYARVLRQLRFVTGGVLHPMAGYLLLRGLSTLPVRIRAASATAAELARRLADHPKVERVHYPRIGGALVSIEVTGDPCAVVSEVRVITPAVSLGSVDSLIQHPGSLTHRIMPPDAREDAGISEQLLRLSIGLEDVEDLWQDLDQALVKA
ncbi:trans-sulfuration enzyme family protein [Kibdelosporangium phytohabitans]|uniref:homocysteine desulfhydrase n=1 Tax=Kibdelosporangium phytohabitans TaxID=860235 RepID=A0A0N9HWR4_9PSEU|nr:aminotransferase class I/II-fold pyridoxal phosphate-dependent enzyme [Kibdelosporangium phytohabitans]ALG07577.1 cystathionine gamma-synthase [Kibdelosporangium phytohabitans]MBE1471481.1 methionine-gamma-lyase [Kibdelosporangium phytohabitans]